jgi:putative SOS response-associated peptidase YedK
MCNDYANRVALSAYREAFAELRIPLRFPDALPNLEPRDDIRPTDPAPIIRAAEGELGAELVVLRWGFTPPRPKAPPVINMRSENRKFDRGRCLVPVSWFYEFTGAKYPKTKHRFDKLGPDGAPEDWFCFAGVWTPNAPSPEEPGRFSLLTTAPGPDVEPIHDRQPVVLNRADWGRWLDPAEPPEPLLRPSPAGSLRVTTLQRAGKAADRLL